jgi:hypothetical protein
MLTSSVGLARAGQILVGRFDVAEGVGGHLTRVSGGKALCVDMVFIHDDPLDSQQDQGGEELVSDG